MAKNTREGASSFDGGTFESYNNQKDWWEKSHLTGYLDEGKIGVIIHYNENNCDDVYEDYKKIYGNNLSYVCEDRNLKRNIHYNDSTTPIITKPLTETKKTANRRNESRKNSTRYSITQMVSKARFEGNSNI